MKAIVVHQLGDPSVMQLEESRHTRSKRKRK